MHAVTMTNTKVMYLRTIRLYPNVLAIFTDKRCVHYSPFSWHACKFKSLQLCQWLCEAVLRHSGAMQTSAYYAHNDGVNMLNFFMVICPIVVDIFQSGPKWWTDQQTNRSTLPSIEP